MKEINLDAKIQFCQMEELSEDDQRLVNKAIEATRNSYAPYSNFHVGACLRTADGMEMIGANQENALSPQDSVRSALPFLQLSRSIRNQPSWRWPLPPVTKRD